MIKERLVLLLGMTIGVALLMKFVYSNTIQRVFFVTANVFERMEPWRPHYYLDQSKDSLLQERPNFAEEFLTEKQKSAAVYKFQVAENEFEPW